MGFWYFISQVYIHPHPYRSPCGSSGLCWSWRQMMETSELEPFRIKEDWEGIGLLGHFVHPLPIQDHNLLYNNFTNVLPSLNLNESNDGDYTTFFGGIYPCCFIFSMKNCYDILLNIPNITIITRITYFLLVIIVSFLVFIFFIYIMLKVLYFSCNSFQHSW